ncbi:MAG: hypothetical protein ACI4O9_08175 [Akkermansia sp.]
MDRLTFDMVVAALRERGSACGVVDPTDYHTWKRSLADEFGCPVVSKSSLCDFDDNPYRYRYNEIHGVRKECAGFLLGSLVDCIALTPKLFDVQYAVEELDLRTKAGRARRDELAALGKVPVKQEDYDLACELALRVVDHLSSMGWYLHASSYPCNCWSQVGLFVYLSEIDGVPLASPLIVTGMVDICPDEGDALLDLKTTRQDPSDSTALFYAMEDFHYGVGAALYLDLFNVCTGEERCRFGHLFVGNQLPAMSRTVWLGVSELEVYRRDYKAMLRRFATAAATDYWGDDQLPDAFYQPTRREAMRFSKVIFGES